jgi:hypothetical protein
VFTARYGLSPYIIQIRLVFKALISVVSDMFRNLWVYLQADTLYYPPDCKTYHTAYTAVSLKMSPRGSKRVEDVRN